MSDALDRPQASAYRSPTGRGLPMNAKLGHRVALMLDGTDGTGPDGGRERGLHVMTTRRTAPDTPHGSVRGASRWGVCQAGL